MKTQIQQNSSSLDITAIKAVASITNAPFKTAFMATLGVGAAQLVMTFAFFGGLATIGTVLYLIAR